MPATVPVLVVNWGSIGSLQLTDSQGHAIGGTTQGALLVDSTAFDRMETLLIQQLAELRKITLVLCQMQGLSPPDLLDLEKMT